MLLDHQAVIPLDHVHRRGAELLLRGIHGDAVLARPCLDGLHLVGADRVHKDACHEIFLSWSMMGGGAPHPRPLVASYRFLSVCSPGMRPYHIPALTGINEPGTRDHLLRFRFTCLGHCSVPRTTTYMIPAMAIEPPGPSGTVHAGLALRKGVHTMNRASPCTVRCVPRRAADHPWRPHRRDEHIPRHQDRSWRPE